MKYKILIIDDELDRHNHYEIILGDGFQLEFIKDPVNEYDKLVDKSYDAYILDVVLPAEWNNCINELDVNKPCVIVSSRWSDAKEHLNQYVKFNIVHFFGWDEFQTQTATSEITNLSLIPSINNKILFALNKYYKLFGSKKEQNGSVKILHLSDLQFGDPSYNENSFLNYDIISNKLIQLGIEIDLILITGDIAFSGLHSEYLDASKWINKLSTNLFTFTNFGHRILLVPGNHDINMDISVLNKWKFNDKYFNPDTITKRDNEVEEREELISDYDLLKFSTFRNFCSTISGNNSYFTKNLSFINDKFANWGVRFVHLNANEKCSYNGIKNYHVSDEILESLQERKNSFDSQNLYTIALCHQGPRHIGYDEEGHKKEWLHLRNFLSLKNTKLYLHGHTHGEFSHYQVILDDKKMDCVQTGTLNLKKLANVDDHRNFLVIELKRENGNVNKVTLLPFNIIKNNVNMEEEIEL